MRKLIAGIIFALISISGAVVFGFGTLNHNSITAAGMILMGCGAWIFGIIFALALTDGSGEK